MQNMSVRLAIRAERSIRYQSSEMTIHINMMTAQTVPRTQGRVQAGAIRPLTGASIERAPAVRQAPPPRLQPASSAMPPLAADHASGSARNAST